MYLGIKRRYINTVPFLSFSFIRAAVSACCLPTQPPTLSGTGNEYQPKYGDALRLGSKGRYGSFHL